MLKRDVLVEILIITSQRDSSRINGQRIYVIYTQWDIIKHERKKSFNCDHSVNMKPHKSCTKQ